MRAGNRSQGVVRVAFVITGGCCGDSSCIPVCPVQCIRPRPGDADFVSAEQLYIDPATCIDCGACMDECPVGAIAGEWDLPEDLEEYTAVNAAYFEEHPIEASSPSVKPRRTLPAGSVLRVAVVGSGPAGCYAASELSDIKGVEVSVFDRLPTPFGLVRAGVAPDHPATKQIEKRFGSVLSRPNVRCYFGVDIGADISLAELLDHHHAVIWAGGATNDRRLDIPGEDLPDCVSAREFVAWYNGHPDFADRRFNLAGSTAVIIGNGNVALDVARVIARSADSLAETDIAQHAADALAASGIRQVVVTARRGPEHAAFTTSELAGLIGCDDLDVATRRNEILQFMADRGRAASLLGSLPDATDEFAGVIFRFGIVPTAIRGDGAVEAVEYQDVNGRTETIPTSLVVRAIGYVGEEIPGLPFDAVTGCLPHRFGRVIDPATGEPIPGMYCSGWIKRGATGMIGTNKADAAETVETLLGDRESGQVPAPEHGRERLEEVLQARVPELIGRDGWTAIDRAERAAGRAAGRPRLKLVARPDLIRAARAAQD